MAESLTHAVFGELRWEAESSWWFTQMRLPAGDWLDAIVEPGDEDPAAFVERAATLFRRAMDAERKILHEAVQVRVLDLHDAWRQEDEPRLTAEGLEEQLELTFVRLDSVAPLVMSYWPGEVFGGHSVDVTVDDQLRVTGVTLVG
jgi:hypothetical protein